MQNPLIYRDKIPDFDRIRPAHFLPAIDHALAQVEEKVKAVKAASPSFVNTVIPLESIFKPVGDIMRLLSNFTSNRYTKELGEIDELASIKVAAATKKLFQDAELGRLFRAVYNRNDRQELDDDDKAILRNLYQAFEESGALLPPEGQRRIREIDERLISLAQKFKDNMQAAPRQQAVFITDAKELAGLTSEQIESFAENAHCHGRGTGWLILPERLMVDELLERAEHPLFREKIFQALNRLGTQAPYDNRAVIAEMQRLRHEFARLLGYPHYAAFARSRAMMTDLNAVRELLSDVGSQALKKFEADMNALEAFAAKHGGPQKLAPWDVSYWAARQRAALYRFDAADFASYLEVGNVTKGLFDEAHHLFGLQFHAQKYPVMHPDTRTFHVTDRQGAHVGILHIDDFARPGEKSGGAWMSQIQMKSEGDPNIIIFNMNITKPPEGKPALMGLSQYITFYHEMGHALQGLLGTEVKYPSLQGTAAPADFVEFHSMVNERRALLKRNLLAHALHVETGRHAPDEIINALIRSKAHFEARELLKLVQNSLRDLAFHSMDPKDYESDTALEESVALKSPYTEHIRAYPLARFSHLFDSAHSGYAAGYVNYLIAQTYAADGFEPFEKDPYGREWASRLGSLYRRGSGGDPLELYRAYRGHDAGPEAMLREAEITPD